MILGAFQTADHNGLQKIDVVNCKSVLPGEGGEVLKQIRYLFFCPAVSPLVAFDEKRSSQVHQRDYRLGYCSHYCSSFE